MSERDLQLMVYRNGPTYVTIGTSGDFGYYKGGTFHGYCPTDKCSHAVLLYGWDDKRWHLQNSWGTDWGYGGHFYLPRGEYKCGMGYKHGNVVM